MYVVLRINIETLGHEAAGTVQRGLGRPRAHTALYSTIARLPWKREPGFPVDDLSEEYLLEAVLPTPIPWKQDAYRN